MRAKMIVESVERFQQSSRLKMRCVSANSYPADGLHEDNVFSKFTPSGSLEMTIPNPALIGVLQPGEAYYLDFTKAGE